MPLKLKQAVGWRFGLQVCQQGVVVAALEDEEVHKVDVHLLVLQHNRGEEGSDVARQAGAARMQSMWLVPTACSGPLLSVLGGALLAALPAPAAPG